MKILTLTNGLTIECFDNADELSMQLTRDIQEFKKWFSSILNIRNGRFENLWVRKGTSNKFIVCTLENRWKSSPRQTLSAVLKANSIFFQEPATEYEELTLNSLIPTITKQLFQIRKGDLGIYALFNPLYGTMRILTTFEEIQADRQIFLENDLETVTKIFTILTELHGSIDMFSPYGVAV